MGIFKRIKTITLAEINALLDGLEDPIAMLNQYSREMEEELQRAQKALARQIYVENRQAALIVDTERLLAKRIRQAKLAIERGEESIAKLAVQEKLIHEKQLIVFKQQQDALKAQTKILLEKINELKEIYNALQHKKILLASRANTALTIKQIQKASALFQAETITRGIARAEDHILMMEAEVQAGNQFTTPLAQQEAAAQTFVDEEGLNKEIEKLKVETFSLVK
ncbi:PspA/IM30 family protein [Neobacillus cucumis]|uniref:PspA/IM30 family protein n=1 Tax=Neobacillus cucumis TaxID=1740721 RepID=UPI001965A9ED|nr:PspA/IM30 family protein [Neobacillus cucumis]MBM7654382.1 phage shock protein A [Neobacillus cucumis]